MIWAEVPNYGAKRMTLTVPLLNASRLKLFLVQSNEKAAAFSRS